MLFGLFLLNWKVQDFASQHPSKLQIAFAGLLRDPERGNLTQENLRLLCSLVFYF